MFKLFSFLENRTQEEKQQAADNSAKFVTKFFKIPFWLVFLGSVVITILIAISPMQIAREGSFTQVMYYSIRYAAGLVFFLLAFFSLIRFILILLGQDPAKDLPGMIKRGPTVDPNAAYLPKPFVLSRWQKITLNVLYIVFFILIILLMAFGR
jgi:hypothetical protein